LTVAVRASCKRRSVPAVLPTIAIAAGAAFGSFHPSLPFTGACAALMVLAAGAACLTRGRPGASFMVAVTVAYGAAGGALAGRTAAHAFTPQLRAQHDAGLIGRGEPIGIEGRLLDDAAPTEYGASLLLSVDRIRAGSGWRATGGGVRLSVGGSLLRDRHADWRAGRRLRLTASLRLPTSYGNPGARDEVAALSRRGIALVGSVKSAALVEVIGRGHALSELGSAIRARVRDAVSRRLESRAPTSAAILTAILIGDRAGLDPGVERRLQEAGTYHVIAISGGNIAVLAALALAVVRLVRAPRVRSPRSSRSRFTAMSRVADRRSLVQRSQPSSTWRRGRSITVRRRQTRSL
jgi:competence protein ComEC